MLGISIILEHLPEILFYFGDKTGVDRNIVLLHSEVHTDRSN